MRENPNIFRVCFLRIHIRIPCESADRTFVCRENQQFQFIYATKMNKSCLYRLAVQHRNNLFWLHKRNAIFQSNFTNASKEVPNSQGNKSGTFESFVKRSFFGELDEGSLRSVVLMLLKELKFCLC